jgi:hypothetical protein
LTKPRRSSTEVTVEADNPIQAVLIFLAKAPLSRREFLNQRNDMRSGAKVAIPLQVR